MQDGHATSVCEFAGTLPRPARRCPGPALRQRAGRAGGASAAATRMTAAVRFSTPSFT
jgi:hypothetical protein